MLLLIYPYVRILEGLVTSEDSDFLFATIVLYKSIERVVYAEDLTIQFYVFFVYFLMDVSKDLIIEIHVQMDASLW